MVNHHFWENMFGTEFPVEAFLASRICQEMVARLLMRQGVLQESFALLREAGDG